MQRKFIAIAGFFGLTAVALGAFAAHTLKAHLSALLLSTFQTGVQYQMSHALALLLVALLLDRYPSRWLMASAWLWVTGIVLFSGSLYGLALGGPALLGPITPLGGICFLLGWACVMAAALPSSAER